MSRRRSRRQATVPSEEHSEPPSGPAPVLGIGRREVAGAVLLSALVLFTYWPAAQGGFIFDDNIMLTENPLIEASDGLYRFWFTTEAPDYWPITATSFWLEWRLWGTSSTGYHVTNLALHALEGLLLWLLFSRLRFGAPWLAATLYVIHPVNVESVAWITQRKNLMAMLFFLLAILSFLKADPDEGSRGLDRGRRRWWYWLSVGIFALAMLSKGSVAVLPIVLLLVLWWRRGHWIVQDLLRVLPFFVVAVPFVLVNIWFQTHGTGPIRDVGLVERVLGAGAVVWFYLWKAVWPANLAFVYPQWHIQPQVLSWWLPLAGAIGVTAVLFRNREGWARPFFMAWAFFCVALVPVMGLTDVYFMRYSLVADHYQHIALVAVCALVAAGWSEWHKRSQGSARAAAVGVAVGAIGLFAHLTNEHSATYKDAETLYRATIAVSPSSWLAHYNLAVDLAEAGRRGEALPHYEQAVHYEPDLPEARVNLALILVEQGRAAEALPHVEHAMGLQPDSAQTRYTLGLALAGAGRPEEATTQFEEVLRLQPDDAEARNALGAAWLRIGRLEEATVQFERALELKAAYPEARLNLAQAHARSGRNLEAIGALEEAVRQRPDLAPAHYNLGLLLNELGRRQEAIAHYEQALRVSPEYAEAHNNLALALAAEGEPGRAIPHLEEAVRLQPGFVEARLNLAVTYARVGRFPEAISHGRAAQDLARRSGRPEVVKTIEGWLANLRRRQ